MSIELKKMPKSLPKTNPYFEIDIVGELTKERYTGEFETLIPNMRIQTKVSMFKAFLNGGLDNSLDAATLNIHNMVAYCKHCLVKCPEWFTESSFGLDLYDYNVLETIYNAIIKKEEEWLKSLEGKRDESGEAKKS